MIFGFEIVSFFRLIPTKLTFPFLIKAIENCVLFGNTFEFLNIKSDCFFVIVFELSGKLLDAILMFLLLLQETSNSSKTNIRECLFINKFIILTLAKLV